MVYRHSRPEIAGEVCLSSTQSRSAASLFVIHRSWQPQRYLGEEHHQHKADDQQPTYGVMPAMISKIGARAVALIANRFIQHRQHDGVVIKW